MDRKETNALKRHKALFAVVAALAAIATALVVESASADPTTPSNNNAYVCYSSVASPLIVSANDTTAFPTWATYGAGYFAPMVESSVPTPTPTANGWYLTCSLPAGWTQIGSYVLGDGKKIDLSGSGQDYVVNGMPIPGVYPIIEPAAPKSGS
jgi:hypothetical protein